MKTAAALALCLCAAAATSDDEQAQARARLLLQQAVEKVRAGVEQGVQGRAPVAWPAPTTPASSAGPPTPTRRARRP